jgi:hypothetical protein
MARVMLVAGLLAAAVGAATADKVTPVQKVVGLLNGMVEKGKKEKHEESLQFATYKQWCASTSGEKSRAIKDGNEAIEDLTADIEKNEATAADCAKMITNLDADISTWEGNLKAATEVREVEAADYEATYKDYGESISALEEGIKTLEAENHATAQASAALLQVSKSPIITPEDKKKLAAFLQLDPEENLAVGLEQDPQAAAYEGQSQGVIDMLKNMMEKFEDERSDLEKMEMNAKFSFETLSQDLKSQIEDATQARSEKTEEKADSLNNAASSKGNLQDTTATRDDDSKYLADLTATCEAKSAAFAERQKLRAEEIAAVEKAIEILSSGAVAGAAETHLPGFLQVKSTQLAQLRSVATNPAQLRVAAFLKDEALRLKSRVISILAVHASEDPMKKVKKMIKDLVVKLMEEANEEAEHKGWCDTELSTNEQTRKEKTDGVEMLTAETDELQASISKLTEELTALTKAVAESDAAVAKATSIRETEKAKNTQTIADAQAAQTAVAQALTVLKDFYEKAGEATAFAQRAKEPEIFDEPYKGMGSENGGVVGMIEVIQSDFARLETDTTAAEEQAQTEYDNFMGDSATDKAQKSTDIEHKTSKKQNQEQTLAEKNTDLDTTQTELNAAMEYYEKLKPSCIDAGVSYEDRVARRKEEIESLQDALKILSGEE